MNNLVKISTWLIDDHKWEEFKAGCKATLFKEDENGGIWMPKEDAIYYMGRGCCSSLPTNQTTVTEEYQYEFRINCLFD